MRRALVKLALLMAGLSIGVSASAEQSVRLIVGGIDKLIYLPVKLAEALGYFRDAGIAVELRSETAGGHAADELLSGTAHGVVGFYDHTIELQAKGKAVTAVVLLAHTPGEAVLLSTSYSARPVRALPDLEGLQVGVTGLGSSTHFLMQYLFIRAGMRPSLSRYAPVGGGASFMRAMRQGEIVAGMVTEPTVSRLIRSGEAQLLVDLRTPEGTLRALGGPYPGACLYMVSAWVTRHREEVQKLTNAIVRSLRFIQSHTAEEIAAVLPSDLVGDDRSGYIRALTAGKMIFTPDGRMPESGPASVLRVLGEIDRGIRTGRVDLGKTFTNEFATAVP